MFARQSGCLNGKYVESTAVYVVSGRLNNSFHILWYQLDMGTASDFRLTIVYALYVCFRSITNAINNLVEPHQNTSDAVDVRQQLDLRIGELLLLSAHSLDPC